MLQTLGGSAVPVGPADHARGILGELWDAGSYLAAKGLLVGGGPHRCTGVHSGAGDAKGRDTPNPPLPLSSFRGQHGSLLSVPDRPYPCPDCLAHSSPCSPPEAGTPASLLTSSKYLRVDSWRLLHSAPRASRHRGGRTLRHAARSSLDLWGGSGTEEGPTQGGP